jgi:membrane protein DedA with SNARE-associated domain
MTQFLLIAAATFVSEDLTCITTGALIAAGKVGFIPGVLACIAGIYFGDLLLYFAGRLIGRPILRWKPLRGLLTDKKLERASDWLAQRGASVVILSRFTPGLRLPTYVAAGFLKTHFWKVSFYLLLASVLWTPLLVGAAAWLGKSLPHIGLAGPAILLVAAPLRKLQPAWQARRRLLGWLPRRTRWESWPPWLSYIPVVPYVLFLGIKHRSLTRFTAANPGIPSGGFVGESKSAILANLLRVPDFVVLSTHLPAGTRFPSDQRFPGRAQALLPCRSQTGCRGAWDGCSDHSRRSGSCRVFRQRDWGYDRSKIHRWDGIRDLLLSLSGRTARPDLLDN